MYEEARTMLLSLHSKGIENTELDYFMGLACFKLGKNQEASVYLEACVSNTKDAKMASKALRNVLKMAVESGDFYEA